MIAAHDRLADAIARHDGLAIAVSGGVDSMTLATFAHRLAAAPVAVIHAVSPAVPPAATARVRARAAADGWDLVVTGTGEFDDPRYRDNPVNRCYFCKTNLYDRIRTLSPHPIASGANLDDLGDYRPGLLAAAERAVVHPYIEAGMDKAAVRALARDLGADDVAELPAQPCLASRVETGIAIDAADLAFVDRVETTLARALPPAATVRCRITKTGVAIEVGEEVAQIDGLAQAAARLCRDDGRAFAGVRRYRRGAMFVRT
ncbi:adenine nucleotide alpha hydrolase [Vineibacter terrae]|uniref:Adenine nucleotide alpha hydrolase n=1 Tax=Vineibacter terrae TaxID=2586908 RepID=A0A5C8PBL2_9HYPH|nr:adenine nucleotide alpha hydrolase [Vineibacter terrae]TXL70964.1 adenine nucleotide alpha hydrolase [Vineibacter terrae]